MVRRRRWSTDSELDTVADLMVDVFRETEVALTDAQLVQQILCAKDSDDLIIQMIGAMALLALEYRQARVWGKPNDWNVMQKFSAN